MTIELYYILKFSSDRLRLNNYKINTSIEEEKFNSNIVNISDSQLVRSWQYITKRKDKYIDDFIEIQFTNIQHYKWMMTKNNGGFYVNNKFYKRLFCGAGHARKSTVIFCEESMNDKLTKLFMNGIDLSKHKFVPAKWSAYFALFSSSSQKVSTPRFTVVKDLEIEKERRVDYVEEVLKGDDIVHRNKTMNIKLNVFDGEGLISLEFAEKWSNELGLDYLSNSFIFRAPYIKGQLIAFDFLKFAKEKRKYKIIDIWNNEIDIRDVDVILTESQFKMASAYQSQDEFQKRCLENHLDWGVSRWTPKEEKSHFWSSYQYLQVLNLDKNEVEKMCEPTIEYFQEVMGMDAYKSMVYLLGDNSDTTDFNWIKKISNNLVKMLLFNQECIKDPYISDFIKRTLNRKIKDSFTGKLIIDGNYQILMADPLALTEHCLGIDVKGLLEEGQSYSKYWLDKNIYKVSSGRSPQTWRSENNILNFVNNKYTEKWFSHLHSGIIISIFGCDIMLWGDADEDGDAVFTTNNQYFIKGSSKGIPVYYDKKLAQKVVIDNESMWKSDISSFSSKIGWITNTGTSMYVQQSMFDGNSPEYNEIENRLIITRKLQGNQIDSAKGIIIKPIPNWTRWVRGDNFHNSLIVEKRPKFMIYLYNYKKKEFEKHNRIYDNYFINRFGLTLGEVLNLAKPKSSQKKIVEKYYKYSPIYLQSNSIMDWVFDYVTKFVQELKLVNKNDFDYSIYLDKDISSSKSLLEKMRMIFKEYNSTKRNIYKNGSDYDSIEQAVEILRNKCKYNISENKAELVNLAVRITYGENKNPEFVWKLFGKELVENVIKNSGRKIKFAIQCNNNEDFIFLGKKYQIKEGIYE